jgi:hypothetical protein
VGESLRQYMGRGERRHGGFLYWIQQRGRKEKPNRWVDGSGDLNCRTCLRD